jgi:hypothetical protein
MDDRVLARSRSEISASRRSVAANPTSSLEKMRTSFLCISTVALTVDAFALRATAATTRRSRAASPIANLLDVLGGAMKKGFDAPVVMGTEEMMSQKEFGTSAMPIQQDLRWGCDVETADRICNYNRHYAECA